MSGRPEGLHTTTIAFHALQASRRQTFHSSDSSRERRPALQRQTRAGRAPRSTRAARSTSPRARPPSPRRHPRPSASGRRARRRSRRRRSSPSATERPSAASTTPVSSIDEGTRAAASPPAIRVLRLQQPARPPDGDNPRPGLVPARAANAGRAGRGRPVGGIVLVRRVLVAKPERDPCAVRSSGWRPGTSPPARHAARTSRCSAASKCGCQTLHACSA